MALGTLLRHPFRKAQKEERNKQIHSVHLTQALVADSVQKTH